MGATLSRSSISFPAIPHLRPVSVRVLALLAALAVVLVATLRPLEGGPYAITWCLACGERGGADAIRNLLLFVPLGMALAAAMRGGWSAVAACAALSLGIEIAQLAIPGRDPSAGDLVFNTLGGAMGIALVRGARAWQRPDEQAAGLLSIAWGAMVWAVVVGTAFLLAPAPTGDGGAMIGREGDDVVLRHDTRAAAMGLDQPVVRWRGAMRGTPADDARPLEAWRSDGRWCVRAGDRLRCGLGATAGRGWAVLAYPDALARRLGGWVDAGWMAMLFLPLGFWMRRGWTSGVACAIALAALVVVPAAGGLAATPVGEWIGAGVGIGIGVVLRRMVGIRRAVR